jgi:3-hydroxyisobutyrate dehydrogenase-like beta-hydroxyacid dehydrogenase
MPEEVQRLLRTPTAATPGSHSPIGLIGCGRMGRPMLEHILAGGFHGVVFDTSPAAAQGLANVRVASSAREVAEACAIVLGCVPTVDAYDATVLGPGSVIEGSKAAVYVHLGTTGLRHVRHLAERLAAAGISLLDAPMSGGVERAIAGTLASMVSGGRPALAAARPLLERYSASVTDLGAEPGAAQAVKLINNMLSAANLALAVEGLLAGVKAGIDPAALVELLRRGTGNSDALATKVVGHVLPRTFDWGGSLEVIAKDMTAWREMADGLDLKCPLSRQVHETYMSAIGQLGKQADMTDIARYLEDVERVTIPATTVT